MAEIEVILSYLFVSILWAVTITVFILVIKKIGAFIKDKLKIESNDVNHWYSCNIENNIKALSEIDIHDHIKVIHTLRKFYPKDFEEFVALLFELKWYIIKKRPTYKGKNAKRDWWIDVEASKDWIDYYIQVKKLFTHEVSVKIVREFNWIMSNKQWKGIIITTSIFSNDSISEKWNLELIDYRMLLSEIESNKHNFDSLPSEQWRYKAIELKAIYHIIKRKMKKYPLEISKENSRQGHSILFWFNQFFIILEQLVLQFRDDVNDNIDLNSKEILYPIQYIILGHIQLLYLLIEYSYLNSQITEICAYLSMVDRLLNYSGYIININRPISTNVISPSPKRQIQSSYNTSNSKYNNRVNLTEQNDNIANSGIYTQTEPKEQYKGNNRVIHDSRVSPNNYYKNRTNLPFQ